MPIKTLQLGWRTAPTTGAARPDARAYLRVVFLGWLLVFLACYAVAAQAQDAPSPALIPPYQAQPQPAATPEPPPTQPSAPAGQSQKILGVATLYDITQELPLAPYTLIQPDPDDKVTPQSIEQSMGRVLAGALTKDKMINLGFEGDSTWLTTRIYNGGSHERWIIDMGRRSQGRLGYIERARAYEMTVGKEEFSLKEITPLDDKGAFAFDVGPNTQKYILLNLKAAAGRPALVPLTLYSQAAYVSYKQSFLNAYFAHSFFLLIYTIFFAAAAIVLKDKKLMLFSAFYLYEISIWSLTEHVGAVIGFSFFDYLIPAMMLGFTLFLIWMTKTFFEFGSNSFGERYVLYGLAWLNVLAAAISYLLPISNGMTQVALLYGAPAITLSILSLMSFIQATNGDPANKFFFYGTIFPLIGLIIVFSGFLNLLPHHPLLTNALWYSVVLQGLCTAIATQKKSPRYDVTSPVRVSVSSDDVGFSKLRETKDRGDHTRLLKVIEKERELLAEFRAKEAERLNEMRIAKEAADEANRAKSAFLAVVSHEIRTPMTGVMGMVRLLLDSSITKQQRDYVLAIQESSEAMMALLNDILDFERIQRGKIELEDISFDLHRLIQGVITLMSGHAVEKNISLSARVDDDLPKFVKGDPTRLRQVLLNLMGNAIKFTKQGSVTLIVKTMNPEAETTAKNNSSDKTMVYFAIQDTGIGISAEGKKNLFTPFAQANSSISRQFGGTGLGLAISKGLIETMGSAVNINSKEGEGSTFFFTLEMGRGLAGANEKPLQKAAETKKPAQAAPLKILVVDDNAITQMVIIGLLQNGGHELHTAQSAEAALEKINRDAFDLIFMDIEMNGMKGNEAAKRLREHRDPVKSQIPVIAVTGNVAKEDMERYLADGMSGFITKPIDPDKLRSIVDEIAQKRFEREIRMPEAADPFAYTQEDFKNISDKAVEMPTDRNIFNPDMLQSLKDTIGAKQLDELLGELITKTEEILQAMSAATENNDMDTLAARAHELKGMAGNFGLVEISALAAQAERKAKTSDIADLSALVGALPGASARAQSALRDWTS